ncbi:MAG: SemiSWEET transporter [Rickettsiales bacterium]|nr:SemiSWEET transporter [Rickettsiales bacterium]
MELAQIIGYLGTLAITVCYIPQVLHTYRSKDVTGISLGMYCALATGVALWLFYGILKSDIPLMLCNSISLLMIISILTMKVLYSKKPEASHVD